MKQYQSKMLEHLAHYKESRLGIEKAFLDNDKNPAELPVKSFKLNCLEAIRKEFWDYHRRQTQKIKLRNTFTNLASSQFMAFNLIFPLINEGKTKILAEISGLEDWQVDAHGFNRVLDLEEQNCFDFWMQAKTGDELFYSIKLAEERFARGNEEEQCYRLINIYKPVLMNIIDSKALDSDLFYDFFQIFQYLFYLKDKSGGNNRKIVCFILTKQNSILQNQLESALHYLKKEYKNVIKVLYLEDLASILEEHRPVYYQAFKEKYLI